MVELPLTAALTIDPGSSPTWSQAARITGVKAALVGSIGVYTAISR